MRSRPWQLAIETSGRRGSIALGVDDSILADADLPEPRRHRVDLMPAIGELSQQHDLLPRDLACVFVSIGPGSFTGLRIAIATAKMFALTASAKLVAVPTLEAMIRRAPLGSGNPSRVAACLNLKRDTLWAQVFEQADDRWSPIDEASLRTIDDLARDAAAAAPIGLLGDPLPDLPAVGGDRLAPLPTDLARPLARDVYVIGNASARDSRFTPEPELLPLYAREPEAVSLWRQRHG